MSLQYLSKAYTIMNRQWIIGKQGTDILEIIEEHVWFG